MAPLPQVVGRTIRVRLRPSKHHPPKSPHTRAMPFATVKGDMLAQSKLLTARRTFPSGGRVTLTISGSGIAGSRQLADAGELPPSSRTERSQCLFDRSVVEEFVRRRTAASRPTGEETAIAGIEQAFVASSSLTDRPRRLRSCHLSSLPAPPRRTPDSDPCQKIKPAPKPPLLPFKRRKRYAPARSVGHRSAPGRGMPRIGNAPAHPSAGRSDGAASVMRRSWPTSTRLGC